MISYFLFVDATPATQQQDDLDPLAGMGGGMGGGMDSETVRLQCFLKAILDLCSGQRANVCEAVFSVLTSM